MNLLRLTFLTVLISIGSPLTARAEFQAGAALSNITPEMGVPLDGAIMQIGPAKDVHDELWVRCIVISDGATKLAFAIVDSTMISREVHQSAKVLIEKSVGIPASHVCIAATHTHSTPRGVVGMVNDPLHRKYLDFMAVRIADGIKRADNRLAPAEAAWGSFDEPEYVHNRRWFVEAPVAGPFGKVTDTIKMNPGASAKLVKPSGPVDSEFFIFALRRKSDQQPIALLGNYGLHYVGGIPRGTVSSDYFGAFSDAIQKQWAADRLTPPFVGALSNGTSGDVNAVNPKEPRKKYQLFERMSLVAEDLANQAADLVKSLEFQSDLSLAAVSSELSLEVRKPDADRLEWAKQTKAPADTKFRLTRPQVYAREALYLAEYPDSVQVPLQVFRIGELAIAQSPCETFAETGLAIKQQSPFPKSTFTIELANGYSGYLPPADQFPFGGYETWPARSSFLEVEAESKIRKELLNLLQQIK